MRDLRDQAAVIEGHEDGVAEGAGLDGEIEALEIGKSGDASVFCLGAEHHGQAGKVIGRRRHQGSERDAPAPSAGRAPAKSGSRAVSSPGLPSASLTSG